MRPVKPYTPVLVLVALALALPSAMAAATAPGQAPGSAKPGKNSNAVTITATPTTVTFGGTTTIAGQVTGGGNAGVQVNLQSVPAPPFVGGKFTDTGATATSDASGNYTFTLVRPPANTNYQVVAKTKPPVTSPIVTVNVRIALSLRLSDSTPARGALVRFFGVAKPAHDGSVLRIQKRVSGGSYRTVAKTVLRKSSAGQSTYSRRLRIRGSGTYRVRVAADTDHAAGTSRPRRITVH
jgi:hypothetical protein